MGLETEESPTITSPGERMRARMGQLEVREKPQQSHVLYQTQ